LASNYRQGNAQCLPELYVKTDDTKTSSMIYVKCLHTESLSTIC